jgi:hypothetical protein
MDADRGDIAVTSASMAQVVRRKYWDIKHILSTLGVTICRFV